MPFGAEHDLGKARHPSLPLEGLNFICLYDWYLCVHMRVCHFAAQWNIAICLARQNNHVCNSWFIFRLVHWLRRKNADCPSDADAGPTSSLRCPHGDLLPEQAAGAKRVVVPESLWLFFYETACSVNPDDLLGCFAFPSDSVPCEICSRDLSEVACLEGSIRYFWLQALIWDRHPFRSQLDNLFVLQSS